MDEKRILARAQAGDKEAFGTLVLRHQSMVYGVALSMLRRPQDAEEVAQTVFWKAWDRLPTFRQESALSTWLYTMTRNAALDHLRKESKRTGDQPLADEVLAALADPAPGPQEVLERKERQAALLAALDKLPQDQRTILLLREFDGLSYQEIAQTLEVAQGTVRSRLSRARRALRELLLADGNFFDGPPSNQGKGGERA